MLGALAALAALMAVPPDALQPVLHGHMVSLHLVLELVAIVIAGLVVAVSSHDFGERNPQASVTAAGFLVVLVLDVMHGLTYDGMPPFLTESGTERAVFFWLMGRTAEVVTLALIAWGGVPLLRRGATMSIAVLIALALVAIGSYRLEWFPTTFVPGEGVTAFKAGFEVALCVANLAVAALLWRAMRKGRPQLELLAMSSVMMGIGELAFTRYLQPSDFQTLFGHAFKLVAYALLYRATFLDSLRAPYEAMRASEARLRESEARLRTLSANLPLCVVYQVLLERDGTRRFVYLSEALARINGLEPADVLRDPGVLYAQFHPDDRRLFEAAVQQSLAQMALMDVRIRVRHTDGRMRRMQIVAAPRRLDDGRVVWDGIETDVTEREAEEDARRGLEAELRQAQKMESIGTLASGIAHDFNNVIAAILGNTTLAQEDAARGATAGVQHGLEQVRKAALRARELVRQILTFGRRQVAQRRTQALQGVVDEAVALVRATLPAAVTLTARFPTEPAWARVDATQVAQVVINLCTNAWQAMRGRPGRIELTLGTVELGRDAAGPLGLAPGVHHCLAVADDGSGMDEATRRRIFEPFFTTRPTGGGTGLGLSVVHGIVVQHDGAIEVESAPGQGTVFRIWLPAAPAPDAAARPEHPVPIPRGHGERVLYVDDDEVMLLMVERLLARHGYAVRALGDPAEALAALGADPQAFDVVVTDYNMPSQSGLDFARAARERGVAVPQVLVSGSVSDALVAEATAQGVAAVVEKQHLLEQLGGVLQNVLAPRRARLGVPEGG